MRASAADEGRAIGNLLSPRRVLHERRRDRSLQTNGTADRKARTAPAKVQATRRPEQHRQGDSRSVRCQSDLTKTTMDFVFIALIVGFFAASAGLIRFCAALMDKGGRS